MTRSKPHDSRSNSSSVTKLVKRHEMAHCNGWPADHHGALPYVEWAEVPDKPATANPAKQDPPDKLLFGRPS
jgi:hypothetical protein